MSHERKNEFIASASTLYWNMMQKILFGQLEYHAKRKVRMRQRFMRNLSRKLKDNFVLHIQNIQLVMDEFVANAPDRKKRNIWTKNRNRQWWYTTINDSDPDNILENFRMDKESFTYLCEKLSPELAPNPRCVREALSIEMKVAIALYKLASCSEYRIVGDKFGVQKSTVQKCLHQFCAAVMKIFLKDEIQLPVGDEAQQIIRTFQEIYSIPLTLGIIDSLHVPIFSLTDNSWDYINSEGWSSIILQILVDCNGIIRSITCKHPGSKSDDAVLRNSVLCEDIHKYDLPVDHINERLVTAFFIGDDGYPLLPWLIKEYPNPQTYEEKSFNLYLQSARTISSDTFRKLKGRWSIMQKRIDIDVNYVPSVIATCCILHNILQRRQAPYKDSWNDSVRISEQILVQPKSQAVTSSLLGIEIRDLIKNHMSINNPLLQVY